MRATSVVYDKLFGKKAACLLFTDTADHHDLRRRLGRAWRGNILTGLTRAGIRVAVLASNPEGLAVGQPQAPGAVGMLLPHGITGAARGGGARLHAFLN